MFSWNITKFCVGLQVQHETTEEGRRMHRSEHCKYNNKDEDNSPNIPSDKNKVVSFGNLCFMSLSWATTPQKQPKPFIVWKVKVQLITIQQMVEEISFRLQEPWQSGKAR